MANVAAGSRPDRLPITDGRSAEACFSRRITADLIAQVGGAPTATQRLLIGRIASLSLRVHLLDQDPELSDRDEYLGATRLLAELLGQLDVPAPASLHSMPANPYCGVAT
jgi:hypothetical protein